MFCMVNSLYEYPLGDDLCYQRNVHLHASLSTLSFPPACAYLAAGAFLGATSWPKASISKEGDLQMSHSGSTSTLSAMGSGNYRYQNSMKGLDPEPVLKAKGHSQSGCLACTGIRANILVQKSASCQAVHAHQWRPFHAPCGCPGWPTGERQWPRATHSRSAGLLSGKTHDSIQRCSLACNSNV